MASNIDTSKPVSGNASSSDERSQKAIIKGEIEALQAGTGLSANVVTNAKLAQIATKTIKGRTTASTGDVEDQIGRAHV